MWHSIAAFVIKFRIALLVLLLAITSLMGYYASKVELSGNKADQKTYFRHSGYMGGERFIPFRRMVDKHPERVIELAVKGMLPKNALGRQMRSKLKVYAGAEHPHEAQRPEPLHV